jgi:hypothetical protein
MQDGYLIFMIHYLIKDNGKHHNSRAHPLVFFLNIL